MPLSEELRRRVHDIACSVVQGDADPLEACLAIYDLYSDLESHLPTEVLLPFLGVGSELDGAPIGGVRQHWAPEALALRIATLDRYRALVGDGLRDDFRVLLSALGE